MSGRIMYGNLSGTADVDRIRLKADLGRVRFFV